MIYVNTARQSDSLSRLADHARAEEDGRALPLERATTGYEPLSL